MKQPTVMSKHKYMQKPSDPPLKPCKGCGAEINANWTIRDLQRKLAEIAGLLPEWYKYDYENPECVGEFMDSADCAKQVKKILESK